MGLFRFIRKLFGSKDVMEEGKESVNDRVETCEQMDKRKLTQTSELKSEPDEWRGRLILSSNDLMQMARKLQDKGEYYRAEQLLRDGVKNAQDNVDYWRLLVEIEEPLNRKGRAYYCLEQILQLKEDDQQALEKSVELKKLIDKDLGYFIEYKLAPEFFRLK